VAIRKLDQSWQCDFTLEGYGRRRKAGFRTKAEAREAERRKREELISGQKRFLMANAYRMYVSATTMKPGSRDNCTRFWRDLESQIGHLYIEQVDTSVIDELKAGLPTHLGPESINNRLKIVRAVLRFMWKRGHLKSVPYVPMESTPERATDWYTEEERDRLLAGMFEMFPRWYAFFYLTTRLGLRTGEVYAIARNRIRDIPPQLIVDRAVQRGNKERPAMLGPRKNNKVLTLALTEDVVDAIRWHIQQGYAVRSSCSAKTGASPRASTPTRGPCGPCNAPSASGRSATIRSVDIRWPAKPRPEVTPSRRFRRSSGTSRPRARISTHTSGSGPSFGWWPTSSPPRHLTSTSGQREKTDRRRECCNNPKPHPNRRRRIRKGATRHGSPLLEAR